MGSAGRAFFGFAAAFLGQPALLALENSHPNLHVPGDRLRILAQEEPPGKEIKGSQNVFLSRGLPAAIPAKTNEVNLKLVNIEIFDLGKAIGKGIVVYTIQFQVNKGLA